MEQDCVNAGTVAKLCDQIQKLESERDALKAHIERLRDVVLDGVLEWVDGNDELLVRRIWDSLRLKMLETTPQQSLAEHDVEVLLKLADYMESGFGIPVTMGCDEVREYALQIKGDA